MERRSKMLWFGLLSAGLILPIVGCRDDAPPPPRVPVPAAGNHDQAREGDYLKPLPPDDWRGSRDGGNPVPPKP